MGANKSKKIGERTRHPMDSSNEEVCYQRLSRTLSGEELDDIGVATKELLIREDTDASASVKCDECFKGLDSDPIGISVCIECDSYFCVDCTEKHDLREGHGSCMNEDSKTEIQKCLFTSVMTEGDRRTRIKSERVSICDGINVNHALDKSDCQVTGLCAIDNNMLIVCDRGNRCIKLINLRSRCIQRYIKFDSRPRDVTLIDIQLDSTVPVPAKIPNMSLLHHDAPSQNRAVAVIFPTEFQIIYMNCNTTPAIKIKTIKLDTQPFKIEFRDEKLYVLCSYTFPSTSWFIYIISIDGSTLKNIDVNIQFGRMPYITTLISIPPDMCVLPERIYITNNTKNKLYCINMNGERISTQTVDEGYTWISGITVDQDNEIYLCTKYDVYKLRPGSRRCTPLLEQPLGRWYPYAPCCYRDKLYISYFSQRRSRNSITVFRLN